MSDYNIQMHEYNGSGYDNLYPKTKAKNVYLTDEYTLEEFWKGDIPAPILDNNSFAVIKMVSDAGNGASYWSVGDRKAVTLKSYTLGKENLAGTYYMSILGFDHNMSYESTGVHTITFQFGWTALTGGVQIAFCDFKGKNCVQGSDDAFRMEKSNTNANGWSGCYMRSTICANFKSKVLPDDLVSVLKSVKKKTSKGSGQGGASSYEETTDYIFLPSPFEIFGVEGTYGSDSQVQYDYYKGVAAGSASKDAFTAASTIRYNHRSDSQSSSVNWWERTPYAEKMDYFCHTNLNGNRGGDFASCSAGFAPCLCI